MGTCCGRPSSHRESLATSSRMSTAASNTLACTPESAAGPVSAWRRALPIRRRDWARSAATRTSLASRTSVAHCSCSRCRRPEGEVRSAQVSLKEVAAALTAISFVFAAPFSSAAPAPATDLSTGRDALRVCADPNNLPQSNSHGEGYENKIAEALARDLGLKLEYTYFPQRLGFVRNTLRARAEP